MQLSRVATALTVAGIFFAGVVGVFLMAVSTATAAPQQVRPSSAYGGYHHESPSPKPSRSRTPSASPSPSVSATESLPTTGPASGNVAVTGIIVLGTGIGLVSLWWVWQARIRERASLRA